MPQLHQSADPHDHEPGGFRRFTSLLLALFAPKKGDPRCPLATCTQQVALRTLHIGAVSWKVFGTTWPAQQALYETAMAQVTDVKLLLDVGSPPDEEGNDDIPVSAEMDKRECRRFFNGTGALRTFLTAAPMLEKLHIEFIVRPSFPILDLRSLVGDGEFVWKALRECKFHVNAREDQLIAFLTRHKTTLRRLTMDLGLTLLGRGSSPGTLLPRMRDAVQWEEITLLGSLRIMGTEKRWLLSKEDLPPTRAMSLADEVNSFLMRRSDVNPFNLRSLRSERI